MVGSQPINGSDKSFSLVLFTNLERPTMSDNMTINGYGSVFTDRITGFKIPYRFSPNKHVLPALITSQYS